jgi:hypothetical protein
VRFERSQQFRLKLVSYLAGLSQYVEPRAVLVPERQGNVPGNPILDALSYCFRRRDAVFDDLSRLARLDFNPLQILAG